MLISEEVCRRMRPEHSPEQDLLFAPKLGIVFMFISKNASSTLKAALQGTLSRRSGLLTSNPHTTKKDKLLGVRDIGHTEMSRLLEDKTVKKALLGRHPTFRFLSAFNSRVRTWNSETYNNETCDRAAWVKLRQEIVGALNGEQGSSAIDAVTVHLTTIDLLNYLGKMPSGMLDRHLVPQSYYAGTDVVDYDIRGRVEELPEFLNRIGLSHKLKTQVAGVRLNATNREDLSASRATERLVFSRYRRDFEYFGYSPPKE